jgi:hypothetical protein
LRRGGTYPDTTCCRQEWEHRVGPLRGNYLHHLAVRMAGIRRTCPSSAISTATVGEASYQPNQETHSSSAGKSLQKLDASIERSSIPFSSHLHGTSRQRLDCRVSPFSLGAPRYCNCDFPLNEPFWPRPGVQKATWPSTPQIQASARVGHFAESRRKRTLTIRALEVGVPGRSAAGSQGSLLIQRGRGMLR